jgi:dTDP-L-rhamnose 4-epimerase
VREVFEALARELGWQGGFEVTQKFRAGDIRHCFADISRARRLLGYAPRVKFEQGVGELTRWVARQQEVRDNFEEMARELAARGLAR